MHCEGDNKKRFKKGEIVGYICGLQTSIAINRNSNVSKHVKLAWLIITFIDNYHNAILFMKWFLMNK